MESSLSQRTAQVERLEQQLLREREISENSRKAIVLLEENLKVNIAQQDSVSGWMDVGVGLAAGTICICGWGGEEKWLGLGLG